MWKPCILETPEVVMANNDKLVFAGQGEGETKWKGWDWKLLLIKLVMAHVKKYNGIIRCN